ncbi:diguanylate cyclase [Nitratidesulfovibrio termitidis]|uniref:diguanylate cyclase n=1 Tax=Nitratidesulfovibrio termitidis TaxID=42252 RepID=UPI00041854CB|nr:diguanylate cyclase [Nitratidesulfovibrio termitidis]
MNDDASNEAFPLPGLPGKAWLFKALSIYCCAVWVDIVAFPFPLSRQTPLSLGSGVAMVICLRVGWLGVPLVMLLSLAVSLLTNSAQPFDFTLAEALAEAMAGGIAAWLMRRVFTKPPTSVPDLFRVMGYVFMPAALVGAGIITSQQLLGERISRPEAMNLFATLVMGLSLGPLLVYPLYRNWTTYPLPTRAECRWIAGGLCGILLCLFPAFNGFGGLVYLILPLLLLLAYHVRLNGLTLVLTVSMMAVTYMATWGFGPFQMPTTGEATFMLATFLCSTTLVALAVSLHNSQLLNADSCSLMWQQKAMCDPLTGIFNRSRFDTVLDMELRRMQRTEDVLSLLMIDVDHFKAYNDTYGHPAGDSCLQVVARTLSAIVHRAPDMVARYGGEEFACVLPNTPEQGAFKVAESIRRAVADLNTAHSGSPVGHLTISVGVTTVRGGMDVTPRQVINMADRALYQSKTEGRDRVVAAPPLAAHESLPPRGELVRFVWSPFYECGDQHIDGQHRHLLELGNQLLTAFLHDTPHADCLALLHDLVDDLAIHFRDEELFQRRIGYPEADEHALIHAALLGAAHDLKAQYERSQTPLGDVIGIVTREVVMRHMLKDDFKFHPYVPRHTA